MSSLNGSKTNVYLPSWKDRLYGYLALARISNSPTVASNVLAGVALAGGAILSATTLMLVVALILFYTAGMYLNDLCDYEIDCRERPQRPLPSGLISRSTAALITALLFAIGFVILWFIGPLPFLGGLVLAALIAVYDLWHKANPVSPLIMAACRVMVYVIAFLAFATGFSFPLAIAAGLLALYLVGLTALAKYETRADVVRYWPAAILFLPAVTFAFQMPSLAFLSLLLLFVAWVAYSISFIYRKQNRSIGGAIGRLIAGISLYDSLVLGAAASLAGVFLAVVAFGLTLFFQRYIQGT